MGIGRSKGAQSVRRPAAEIQSSRAAGGAASARCWRARGGAAGGESPT
jgi:hypothetical protein